MKNKKNKLPYKNTSNRQKILSKPLKVNNDINSYVKKVLDYTSNKDFMVNKILADLLSNKVLKKDKNLYKISREMIRMLNKWYDINAILDSEEKIELYQKMKDIYLQLDASKLDKFKGFYWEEFVELFKESVDWSFFKEIDEMAFDCSMWYEELLEYVLFMDNRFEVSKYKNKLDDLFINYIMNNLKNTVNFIYHNPSKIAEVVDLELVKLSSMVTSINKNTLSFLNSFLTDVYESLAILYILILFRSLQNNYMEGLVEWFAKYIFENANKNSELFKMRKYLIASWNLENYRRKVWNFLPNIENQYMNMNWLDDVDIHELEKKVSEQWILKKINEKVINLWIISLKIIPFSGDNVSDKSNLLFTVWVNFEWIDNFWVFESKYVNWVLFTWVEELHNSVFLSVNSYWELSVVWGKKSLSFFKNYDIKLKKIILSNVLEYLNTQEDYLGSFFLIDEDIRKFNKDFSLIDDVNENDLLEKDDELKLDELEIEINKDNIIPEQAIVDEYEDVTNLENDENVLNIDKKIQNNKREALNKVRWYTVNKVYSYFEKIL